MDDQPCFVRIYGERSNISHIEFLAANTTIHDAALIASFEACGRGGFWSNQEFDLVCVHVGEHFILGDLYSNERDLEASGKFRLVIGVTVREAAALMNSLRWQPDRWTQLCGYRCHDDQPGIVEPYELNYEIERPLWADA